MIDRFSADTRPIVIAGLGLISPLGHGAWPTFSALLAGKTLAERARGVAPAASAVELVIASGAVSIVRHTSIDPAVDLAESAAREALLPAKVDATGVPTYLGTSKGAVTALGRAAKWACEPKHAATDDDTPLSAVLGPHGYLAHHLTRRLGLNIQTHQVAACASSLTALHRARLALADEAHPDYAMALTAEAALLPMFIHSYRRLGVLAPLTPTAYRARPLDERRCGFMLSEMGAAILLKRLPPGESPKPGQWLLEDTAIASESYDLLRSNPKMTALRHVAASLLRRRTVDVIHPHAPGTDEHDLAELAALDDVLKATKQQHPPDVYAVKGALGHSLGAAGLTSLVIACLCLQSGTRPVMPWLERPIDTTGLNITLRAAAQPCSRTGRHAVFAAGFAGHTAGAVVRREP